MMTQIYTIHITCSHLRHTHITGLQHSIIIFRSLFSLFNKLLERMKKIKEFFIDCNNDIVITEEFVYI